MSSSRWPRSPSHGKCSRRFCGSSRNCGRSHHQRQRETFDVMHSRAIDRRSASKCQGKCPDQTLDQAFGLSEVLVAVSTLRLSCKRAGQTRTLMPAWDSSGESRLKTLEIAREMVARPPGNRPEYIVVTDDYSVADRLLAIIDPAGVKSFLADSSIPVDQRGGIGSPRGKYKGWLGSLEPQAEDAGYLTARALIERGKKEKAFGRDGKLHMLAIAGDRSTPSSINRIKACAARSPKRRWSFSRRRFTRRGRARTPPSKPSRSTGVIPMSSSPGRATI